MSPLIVGTEHKAIVLSPYPNEEQYSVIRGLGIGGIMEFREPGLEGESLEFHFGNANQKEIERFAQTIVEGLGKAGCEAAFLEKVEPEPVLSTKHSRVPRLAGRILHKTAKTVPVAAPI